MSSANAADKTHSIGGDAGSVSYPDLSAEVTSPTDSVIAGDFGAMTAEEQERQREEWKQELKKTEEEILTLKQVLASKEQHAIGLKRRLGITAWREFSEDMSQGLKNLQDSAAYKKTAEGIQTAKEKTAGLWSSVTNSQGFQKMSGSVGNAFGAAKSKISSSMSHQENLKSSADGTPAPANAANSKENK